MADTSTQSIPIQSTSTGPTKSSCKYTKNDQRIQALTLYGTGTKISEIEAITGIKANTFYAILRRAKERGYVPGGPVKEEHVANAPKSRRPKAVTEPITEAIEEVVTKNSTTRQYSCQQIADDVAQLTGKKLNPSTIWQWLKKAGFKNVKLTTKPGLNKAQKMARLEFAMRVKDWTLDDWKKVV